ncbi:MAG: hypothetical protein ACE5R6_11965 [Candidatus Heimdallarchaeota archaeon]
MEVSPPSLFKGLIWVTLDWMGSRVLFNQSVLTETEATYLGEQGARLIQETMPRRNEIYGPIPVANRPNVHVLFYVSVLSPVTSEIGLNNVDPGLHNIFFVLYAPDRAKTSIDLVPFYRELLFSQIKEWETQGPLSVARLATLYSQLSAASIFQQQPDTQVLQIDEKQQVLIQYMQHMNRLRAQQNQLKQRVEALQREQLKKALLHNILLKYAERDPTMRILVLLSKKESMDIDELATTVGQTKLMLKMRLSRLTSSDLVIIHGKNVQLSKNAMSLNLEQNQSSNGNSRHVDINSDVPSNEDE